MLVSGLILTFGFVDCLLDLVLFGVISSIAVLVICFNCVFGIALFCLRAVWFGCLCVVLFVGVCCLLRV